MDNLYRVYCLFLFNRLHFVSCHVVREVFVTITSNHVNAGISVGFKDEPKNFGHEVVILLAIHGIGKLFAIGAAGVAMLYIT